MTNSIHAAMHARTSRMSRTVEDELEYSDLDDLDLFGSDERELAYSGQTGCFRIGCGGKRILLDDLGV
jgi:hypothetical protein